MQNNYLDVAHFLDDLGELDETWRGWKLRRGQLFDPWSSAVIGFRPPELRALPIHLQRIAALERQLRQLTILSQLTQAIDQERRSGLDRRISRRGTAPVSRRIDPALVRADPARHKRSL